MEAVAVQTTEERIAQDVAQFDPAAAKLERFREFKTLRINGPQDADGKKMVGEARLKVKRERTGLERLRKQFVEDAVKYQKGINDKAREYREAMEEIEAHLEQEEAKVQQWANEAREAEERAAKKRIDDRKEALYRIGLSFNGQGYAHPLAGVPSVSEQEVTGLDDGPFAELLDMVSDKATAAKEEADRARIALEEQARKDREERERVEAIAQENARKERELKEREDRMNGQVEQTRRNELLAIGAMDLEMPYGPLHQYTDEAWPEEVRMVRVIVDKRKADEVAAAERAQAERIANEQRIREEAATAERKRIEDAENSRKEAEAEAIRRRGDVGAFEALIAHLDDTPWPVELKSSIAVQSINLIKARVMGARDIAHGTLTKDLK